MTEASRHRLHWLFAVAAIIAWLAVGWPVFDKMLQGRIASTAWIAPYLLYGVALVAATMLRLRSTTILGLAAVQSACAIATAALQPAAVFAVLLVATAWLVAIRVGAPLAIGWIAAQSLGLVLALAERQPDFQYCYILGLATALQIFFVFTAHAMRTEEAATRALRQSNLELRAAQAMLANNVRAAERTRISRELHDAWGHELTALGLQLEIASHTAPEGGTREGVVAARGMARNLLEKVRDVVSTLREAERCDLEEALETLARSVPAPRVHVELERDLVLAPDQAHALMRCAQEAVTNAVRHARAANLWLSVRAEASGIRLVARDDGEEQAQPSGKSNGLSGMRERLEALGGRLEIRASIGKGFELDAWLPAAEHKRLETA